ncbi:MAG: hypothetical protein LAO77_09140 [Acidobacteriia bacterium]|nr:hypothetical protein [Terriglobia bacterium]
MSRADAGRAPLGGDFALDPAILDGPIVQQPDAFFALDPDRTVIVDSGRSALRLAIAAAGLLGKTILLPDYLCGGIFFDVLESMRVRWRLFPVQDDLLPRAGALEALAGDADAVLTIDYFGLVSTAPLLDRLKQRYPALVTILDAVQDTYQARVRPVRPGVDFMMASFRKTFPVPDGGFLWSRTPVDQRAVPLAPSRRSSSDAWLAGALLKHGFAGGADGGARERAYLSAFEQAKRTFDGPPAGMSECSLEILRRLDLEAIAAARVANYRALASALRECRTLCPIVPVPGAGHVPLFLPVRVARGGRTACLEHLRARAIYCPVHWPRDARQGATEAASLTLHEDTFSLPVDQRLSAGDLARVTDALLAFDRKAA